MFSANTTHLLGKNTYVEDVFAATPYYGNGLSQDIVTGIDFQTHGGMVWTKSRSNTNAHYLVDSARGNYSVGTNDTGPQVFVGSAVTFASTGYMVSHVGGGFNNSTTKFVSWQFRKCKKFFDVVTYTGTSANRTVAHNLGAVPGCIIIKRTDSSTNWMIYHRAVGNAAYVPMTATAKVTSATAWNNQTPTDTEFSLGTDSNVNSSGGTYVAYLFAHDAGGFGDDGLQNIITCGSYAGNSLTDGPTINLGYEPQYLFIRNADAATSWYIYDSPRGIACAQASPFLTPAVTTVESTATDIELNSTGFKILTNNSRVNGSGNNHIYIAIRRGPMKNATSGTKVYSAVYGASGGSGAPWYAHSFPVDVAVYRDPVSATDNNFATRLLGTNYLTANSSNPVFSQTQNKFDYKSGWSDSYITGYISWGFARAPGFMDVLCYRGDGTSNRALTHGLRAVPQLAFFKRREGADQWLVLSPLLAGNGNLFNANAFATYSGLSSTPWTDSTIYISNPGYSSTALNGASGTYVAYLFGTAPGVSKVGTYTGNGSSQTIDCGFSTGARFVLIKRTDSTGDWQVYDTLRGITTGSTDKRINWNATAAQVDAEALSTHTSGFTVVQNAASDINVNGATYLYLAIA